MTKLRLSMFLLVCILGTSFIPCYAENNVSSNKKSETTLNQDASSLNGPKRRKSKRRRGRRGQSEQQQFRVGIELGGNMSSMKPSSDYEKLMKTVNGDTYKNTSGYGFQGGVYGDYNMNEMFFLEGGLYIMQRPYKEAYGGLDLITGSVSTSEITYSPMYIQVPILFGVNFSISDNFSINLKAGPYFAYGISGKADIHQVMTSGFSIIDTTMSTNYFDSYEGLDLGLRAGAGIEFSKFTLGFFMDYGLLNTLKNVTGSISTKNFSLGLNVGYKF
ncbi:MAG: porin family protein [Bacteroidales bacterium]|jgi:hypothetical protein